VFFKLLGEPLEPFSRIGGSRSRSLLGDGLSELGPRSPYVPSHDFIDCLEGKKAPVYHPPDQFVGVDDRQRRLPILQPSRLQIVKADGVRESEDRTRSVAKFGRECSANDFDRSFLSGFALILAHLDNAKDESHDDGEGGCHVRGNPYIDHAAVTILGQDKRNDRSRAKATTTGRSSSTALSRLWPRGAASAAPLRRKDPKRGPTILTSADPAAR
jgi:hypothetical protein